MEEQILNELMDLVNQFSSNNSSIIMKQIIKICIQQDDPNFAKMFIKQIQDCIHNNISWMTKFKISYIIIYDAILKLVKKNYTFYIEEHLTQTFVQLYSEIFYLNKYHRKDQTLQFLRNIRMTWKYILHQQTFDEIRIKILQLNIEDINFGFNDTDVQLIQQYYKLNNINFEQIIVESQRQYVVNHGYYKMQEKFLSVKDIVYRNKKEYKIEKRLEIQRKKQNRFKKKINNEQDQEFQSWFQENLTQQNNQKSNNRNNDFQDNKKQQFTNFKQLNDKLQLQNNQNISISNSEQDIDYYDNQKFDYEKFINQNYDNKKFNYQNYDNEKFDNEKFNNEKFDNKKFINQNYDSQKFDSQYYDNRKFDRQYYDNRKFDSQYYDNEKFINQNYDNEKFINQNYDNEKFINQNYDNKKFYRIKNQRYIDIDHKISFQRNQYDYIYNEQIINTHIQCKKRVKFADQDNIVYFDNQQHNYDNQFYESKEDYYQYQNQQYRMSQQIFD